MRKVKLLSTILLLFIALLTLTSCIGSGGSDTVYDDNGKLLYKRTAKSDGSYTEFEYAYENGEMMWKKMCSYDDEGNLTNCTEYKNDRLMWKKNTNADGSSVECEYDEYGVLAWEKTIQSDGTSVEKKYLHGTILLSEKTTDLDGTTVEKTYQGGTMVSEMTTEPDGTSHEKRYSGDKLVWEQMKEPDGSAVSYTYVYNSYGGRETKKKQTTNPDGSYAVYEYDDYYRDSADVTFYDASGNPTSPTWHCIFNNTGKVSIYGVYNVPQAEVRIPTEIDGCPVTSFNLNSSNLDSEDEVVSVIIPDGFTTISSDAFRGCSNLKSIKIPDSVTTIGEDAFLGCTSLTNVYYAGDIASWCRIEFDEDGTYLLTASNLYLDGKLLTNLVIPDGVTSIADSRFSWESVTGITIPNSVTTIARGAFSDCINITTATMPTTAIWAIPQDNLQTVVLTGGTEIGACAFSGCTTLTSIVISDSVTAIGWDAFSGCTSLSSVTFGNGLTFIGAEAFSGCESLASLTLPDSFTCISDSAFKDCTGLTSITIPDGVTEIGYRAFFNCPNLSSITIPDSVTKIDTNAFYVCFGLKSITIGSGMKDFGYYTLQGCNNLERIIYKGTVNQFYTLCRNGGFELNWIYTHEFGDIGVGPFTVYCTDGTISRSEVSEYT